MLLDGGWIEKKSLSINIYALINAYICVFAPDVIQEFIKDTQCCTDGVWEHTKQLKTCFSINNETDDGSVISFKMKTFSILEWIRQFWGGIFYWVI